ncbi:ROK family protein [Mucilaginibacter sp. UR6-1]|uniref:ROK family transcriptional regulator n=1 Tax=Mucilaginibacter sp. UR6-1 TaxID=1435643 RepID=UPI001E303A3D|nr:ROK family transcriptional regulator [Mucilaginibacter sp. UR6-1]MCC8410127.1 ROK family protein [Mucilaginibacter sp. UR6-1]
MFNANKKTAKLYAEIIQQLYYGEQLSSAELSARIDKSIPLVTKAVNHLIEAGFVVEQGYAPSSGGRRPLMYSVRHNRLYIVTVAMDQLSTRIGIVDLLNNFVSPIEIISLKLKDNAQALDSLVDIISKHVEQSGVDKEKIIGVGIGMPGFVNVNEGINYTYLDAGKKTLTEYLSDKVELPVYIDNDSSLIALSELKFGIAKSIKDVMVINIGWGIGLGMIINGQIFRGENGFAGEFSHIPIAEEGALCACGKQGCLEAEASLMAVAQKAIEGVESGQKSSLQQYITDDHSNLAVGNALMDAANKGDQYAIELLSDAAYKIGRALSILIHILNPKAIVLSGRGVKVGKLLLAPIQQALNKYCIPRLAQGTELFISDIGFDAELIGAAILVMESFNKVHEASAKASA